MRVTIALVHAVLVLGCGADDSPAPRGGPPTGGCSDAAWKRADGVCVPAGLPPDMPCPPGEWLRDDACIPAGVPPDGCGEGFLHDGAGGCDAILPEAPCPSGLMAVPGDTVCREIAPCAAGQWGDIPVRPDTEYVDQSYAGTDSNGSAVKPWTSIQAGVEAAASGAIVAIAEGSYIEDVTVSAQPVRLWGVCPALVELVGTGAELGALRVLAGAAATEVRSLAIRGEAHGVVSSGSLDLLLEQVWVHDNAGRGINVQNDEGPTSFTLRGSLVEQSHGFGVFVGASEATLETSVVRGTQPDAEGLKGHGVSAQANPSTGAPAKLLLHGSLVEQSRETGVFVVGSEATVEASVVRDTQPSSQGAFGGRGVNVEADPATGAASTLLFRTSVVEKSHDVGVFVAGSMATVEASVVRDTKPDARGPGGRGVNAQGYPTTGGPSTLVLRTSLVERSHEMGVFVDGSVATLEATVVRDTQPDAQGFQGHGVAAQADATGAPSTLLLRASVVERSHEVGVHVSGSEGTLDASVVRDTRSNLQGYGGRGVNAQPDATTRAPSTLRAYALLVEQSHQAGLVIAGSVGMLESCLVRDTLAEAAGQFGDGVIVVSELGSASATVTATRIERSARAAIAVHGGHAAIGGSALSCQAFDLNSESYQGTEATLEDLGGNLCGCPEATTTCAAVSARLEPPGPLEPGPEP